MKRRRLLLILCLVVAPRLTSAADAPRKPINLLFIITDQQRWDTLGCAGNTVIKTPNIDRLAREGARFSKMYSSCPVCVPARTTILTGHSSASSGVLGNDDVNRIDLPDLVTFDQLLLRSGHCGEYHGKWHSPYKYALEYTNGVRWVNGPRPPGSRADMNEGQAFKNYLDANVTLRPLRPGEHLANMYGRPYRPDPLDGASRMTPEQVAKLGKDKVALAAAEVGQGTSYGCLDVPPEYTLAAWTAKEGLAALERLTDKSFG